MKKLKLLRRVHNVGKPGDVVFVNRFLAAKLLGTREACIVPDEQATAAEMRQAASGPEKLDAASKSPPSTSTSEDETPAGKRSKKPSTAAKTRARKPSTRRRAKKVSE